MDKPKCGDRTRIVYIYGVDSMRFYVGFSSGFRLGIPVVLAVFLSGSMRAQIQFDPPIEGPWSLSGTFGELRNNHFHSGVDFKTAGKEGIPVVVAADGCLSRIRQGATGYGLALYFDHDTLFTSVYAHLYHAEPGIAAFLDSLQWANRKFEIDTAILPGRFCFRRGDVVAISGNSGSSEGPHLHFEIRDLRTQEPFNPLPFLSEIRDTVPPLIQKIALYSRTGNRFVRDTIIDCNPLLTDTIIVKTSSKEFAIGLAVDDPERLGVYAIDWSIDSVGKGGFRFDRFSFSETRFVNAHSDWIPVSGGSGIRFHRLFRLPGDSCSMFRGTGDCILKFDSDSAMKVVRLECSDWHGNRDSLFVQVLFTPESTTVPKHESGAERERLVFGQVQKVPLHGGAELILTSKALYQDELFDESLHSIKKAGVNYHPVIPELEVQFHEPQALSLPIPAHLRKSGQKLITIRSESAGGKVKEVLIPTKQEGHHALFKIRSGGWYAMSEDRSPPVIDAWKPQVDPVDSTTYMQCRITDEWSGIARYEVKRNHRWILAEYDAKSGRLRWKPGPVGQGPDLISIVLEDKCGNSIRFDTVETIP